MKILYVASEAAPFCASGGLGDVMGSLPAAVKAASPNDDVRVILPLYGSMNPKYRETLEFVDSKYITLSWRSQYCGVFKTEYKGVTYYFLDNEYYFKRAFMYGEYDDAERFAFFCRACVDILPLIDFYPDVWHANDWQSALTVIYLKRKYGLMEKYADIKTILTIHNIQYQGQYGFELLGDIFDLMPSDDETVRFGKDINLLKGGIVCADMITTVSPTYAKEILSPKFSHGLDSVLELNKGKLFGILNGIDTAVYDPAKDSSLYANYSVRNRKNKAICKAKLLSDLGLEANPEKPVIAVISRLVDHKGLDLLTLAAEDILASGAKLVILGKGDYYYENFFWHLADSHPENCKALLEFNRDLAMKIYSGADMFLMPSRSEPCGLSQMIASHYGTVPVVHETGGLYDSIRDFGCVGGGNGFTFANYSAWDMLCTVHSAIDTYNDKASWSKLIGKVMKVDFSWEKSAIEYLNLYKGI